MSDKSKEKRFRTTNILIGMLMITFSIVAIMYPTATNLSVAFLLSVVLLLVGIGRIANAVSDEKLSNIKVISRFVSGFIALILALIAVIMIVVDPITALDWWYFLVAIALLITGLARIALGIGTKEYEKWFRITLLIIGFLTLIFSIIVLLIPNLAGNYVVLLVAISFLINGFVKIILGAVGQK